MDMEPLEGSQYWVCPVIVEYMNDRFDKELLRYIQENADVRSQEYLPEGIRVTASCTKEIAERLKNWMQ